MAVDIENTKFSDIDVAFTKSYLRLPSTANEIEVQLFLSTAKGFVIEHSKMTVEELNQSAYANVILLKMVSDLYFNRSATGGGAIEPIFDLVLKNLRSYSNVFGTPEA
jgi:hypothetical protein